MISWIGSGWSDDGASFFDCCPYEGFDCGDFDLCFSLELFVAVVEPVLLSPITYTADGAVPSLDLRQEVRLF